MSAPPDPAWYDDPLEVDRHLEGEDDDTARAARAADLARDPALAARLADRARFLQGLAAAGARRRAGLRAGLPAGLEERVRFALRRAAAAETTALRPASGTRSLRWLAAAAAVLVAALSVSLVIDRGPQATAMPPEVIHAADLQRAVLVGPRTCEVRAEHDPLQFPPVKDGALQVLQCRESGERTEAKLHRPEDLPSVGYAAIAAEGVERGPDLGMTDLGDVVVYDLVYGRRRHYLAVSKAFLDRERLRAPGRESCRACHNLSREGQENPHNIVRRSWRLGG